MEDVMKSAIPNCVGVRCKFRERLLIVRGPSGMEFSVLYHEIDESSEVQDVRDHGTLVTRRSFAEVAGLPSPPEQPAEPAPPPEPTLAASEAAQENEMAYEQKDMSGALFKHDKEGNEKAPDYSGTCMIGNRLYFISAWLKTAQSGSPLHVVVVQAERRPAPKHVRSRS
jgi:hypothetical protein